MKNTEDGKNYAFPSGLPGACGLDIECVPGQAQVQLLPQFAGM